MNKQTEALKLAVEALEILSDEYDYGDKALEACKEALEQPAPSWQGLSDDEITKVVSEMPVAIPSIFGIARAIEQALKEKNHG